MDTSSSQKTISFVETSKLSESQQTYEDRPLLKKSESGDVPGPGESGPDSGLSEQAKLEKQVKAQMPPVYHPEEAVIKYKSAQLETQHATMTADMGELKKSTFRQKNAKGEKVDNSELMLKVKDSISKLNSALEENITANISKDFEGTYSRIISKYDDVIEAAEYYASKRKWCFTTKGRQRRAWVKSIKEQCEYEKTRFRQAMTDVYSLFVDKKLKGDDQNPSLTYADVLRYVRSDVIMTQKTGMSGGNNSDVFTLNGHDDRIFKKAETVDNTFGFVAGTILNSFKNAPRLMNGPKLIRFSMAYFDQIEKYINESGLNGQALEALSRDVGDGLIAIFSKKSIYRFAESFDSIVNVFRKHTKIKPRDEYYQELENIWEKYMPDIDELMLSTRETKELSKVLSSSRKNLTGIGVAQHNEIHMGANLTIRNTATCRMAKLTGMEDLVTKCENVVLLSDTTATQAISMERAKGISLGKFIGDMNGKPALLTPKAARDILRLQFFDLICGQADRHAGNVFITYQRVGEKVYITGIKGIDNDMAFGNLRKRHLETGFNRMAWLYDASGNPAFSCIDEDTYKTIVGLKDKKELVRYILADTDMNKDDFEALEERIDTLADYLIAQKAANPHFIIKADEVADMGNIMSFHDMRAIPKNNSCLTYFLALHNMFEIAEIPKSTV